MAIGSTAGISVALGVAFELATHVIVHYTIPGAAFAAGLAQFLAPGLDAMGLTTVFTDAAGSPAVEQIANLPSLEELAIG